jgi:hypothetical protein
MSKTRLAKRNEVVAMREAHSTYRSHRNSLSLGRPSALQHSYQYPSLGQAGVLCMRHRRGLEARLQMQLVRIEYLKDVITGGKTDTSFTDLRPRPPLILSRETRMQRCRCNPLMVRRLPNRRMLFC